MEPRSESSKISASDQANLPWFQRLSRPILFLIVSLALVGGYFAFLIPVSVFPNTDFPRIVIGVDNGVMPIDQMLVTITRDRKSTRLNSSHQHRSRMPSSA